MEEFMLHRLIVLAGFCVLAVTTLAALQSAPANALAGCCKMKNDGLWTITDLSVDDCKSQNQELDGDNVLKQAGRVWWDISC
jgi:hypothetical protein